MDYIRSDPGFHRLSKCVHFLSLDAVMLDKMFFFSESELCQLHFKHLYHSFAFVLSLLCTEIGQTVWLVLKTPRE